MIYRRWPVACMLGVSSVAARRGLPAGLSYAADDLAQIVAVMSLTPQIVALILVLVLPGLLEILCWTALTPVHRWRMMLAYVFAAVALPGAIGFACLQQPGLWLFAEILCVALPSGNGMLRLLLAEHQRVRVLVLATAVLFIAFLGDKLPSYELAAKNATGASNCNLAFAIDGVLPTGEPVQGVVIPGIKDAFNNCVNLKLFTKICAFNSRANMDSRFADRSYGNVRKQMNEFGLSRKDGVEVDVGHVIPDPSKAELDKYDRGWNMMAQPALENIRLGHRTMTCETAARWCRTGVPCDEEKRDADLR